MVEGEVSVEFWFWFEEVRKVEGVGGMKEAWVAQVSSSEITVEGSDRVTKARAVLVPRWSRWMWAYREKNVSFRISSLKWGRIFFERSLQSTVSGSTDPKDTKLNATNLTRKRKQKYKYLMIDQNL